MDFNLALTEKNYELLNLYFQLKYYGGLSLWIGSARIIFGLNFVYCTDLYKSNNNCSNFNVNKLFYQEI